MLFDKQSKHICDMAFIKPYWANGSILVNTKFATSLDIPFFIAPVTNRSLSV